MVYRQREFPLFSACGLNCGLCLCPRYQMLTRLIHLLHTQFKNMEKAKTLGITAYQQVLEEKVGILEVLLNNYDDGRQKGFICLAINLLALQDIKEIMKQVENIEWQIQAQRKSSICCFSVSINGGRTKHYITIT